MAPLAARRLAEMVALGESVVAIELVVAPRRSTSAARPPRERHRAAHARVREIVPFLAEGDPLPDLEPVRELIGRGRSASEPLR